MGNCCSKKRKDKTPTATAIQSDGIPSGIRTPPRPTVPATETVSEKRTVTPSTKSSPPPKKIIGNTESKGRAEKFKLTFEGTKLSNQKRDKNGQQRISNHQFGKNDRVAEYVQSGQHLSELIENNPPPKDWNDELVSDYPIQCMVFGTETEQPVYQVIIHINDESLSVKRSFLAFYKIQPHLMHPEDFVQWCRDNKMHNTISDLISLYIASRYYGPGSTCLRGLMHDKRVINIEMTDRFFTPRGVYRAIVFRTSSMPSVYRLVNTYLQRLSWTDYLKVRCTLPDISTTDQSKWKRER
ncbi:hypothetical protein FGIG_00221 [Fasciola gigantica]|uniref:Uncharacterized protein n=1 Tax=Fasciola gigantica TaxID=46835 RepID=A0A504YHP1_FASGI|nr:hypothetical protein FGIG_00221 [Fasciola gigantica]